VKNVAREVAELAVESRSPVFGADVIAMLQNPNHNAPFPALVGQLPPVAIAVMGKPKDPWWTQSRLVFTTSRNTIPS
jgi:hypothetical protein